MLKKIFLLENKILFFLLISLFFHCLAAYFSVGYYQQDEHFSVLEPINYKLGKDSTLGWDYFYLYNRSWFLTSIFYSITKLLSLFTIYSPFKLAFAYRLFASILGWLSIICLIHISKKIVSNKFSFYLIVLISTMFWFYPYLHARTSSESIGSSFLIIGITVLLYSDKKQLKNLFFIISGIILGLSFLARYTNIVPIFGFGMWILLINKNKFHELFFIALGFTIVFLIGVLIDYWGYNQFLLSSLNYYLINFEHNQSKYFPSSPWWYYFYLIIKEFLPPLSLIILLSMLFFWIKLPKNFVTWITLPLFIFLSLVSHKEIRFLFPILVFSPLFIGYFVDTLLIYKKNDTSFVSANFFIKHFQLYRLDQLGLPHNLQIHFRINMIKRRIYQSILVLIIISNFVALIILSLVPANNSINLFKFLYKNPYQIDKLYTLDNIPYKKSDLLINFYRNTDINIVKVMNTTVCIKELFEKNGQKYIEKEMQTSFFGSSVVLSEELNFPELQTFSYPKWIFEYKIICNKQRFINDHIITLDNGFFLFSDTTYLNFFNSKKNSSCKLIYNTYPTWLLKININNWQSRMTQWYLFNCEF